MGVLKSPTRTLGCTHLYALADYPIPLRALIRSQIPTSTDVTRDEGGLRYFDFDGVR